jgi:hypothetical protein
MWDQPVRSSFCEPINHNVSLCATICGQEMAVWKCDHMYDWVIFCAEMLAFVTVKTCSEMSPKCFKCKIHQTQKHCCTIADICPHKNMCRNVRNCHVHVNGQNSLLA